MVDFAARRTVMVDTQVRPADVTKCPIIEAMLAVPRADFVPVALREAAYL
ncbi:MAG: protein-L-isoaspartate O-methyltransferase, partial [Pseudomonadota bacterium]